MVTVAFDHAFKRMFSKIKDASIKTKLIKQFEKIHDNPKRGKPMRFSRKGTREMYVPPFRSSYIYLTEEDKIAILDIYHKDEQ